MISAGTSSRFVAIRKMPAALVARLAGFETRAPFEAADGARTAPTVQF